MGREIVKVPRDFVHPGLEVDDPEPGAHHEVLYYLPEHEKTCFQIYENVTEGTPVSPIFETIEDLASWLERKGNDKEAIAQFLEWGHYPSLVTSADGTWKIEP